MNLRLCKGQDKEHHQTDSHCQQYVTPHSYPPTIRFHALLKESNCRKSYALRFSPTQQVQSDRNRYCQEADQDGCIQKSH
jgi:hypothetical protein